MTQTRLSALDRWPAAKRHDEIKKQIDEAIFSILSV